MYFCGQDASRYKAFQQTAAISNQWPKTCTKDSLKYRILVPKRRKKTVLNGAVQSRKKWVSQEVLLGTPCCKGFRQFDTPVSESSRWRISWYLAETQGFEPWIRVLHRCALSRGVPSTTRPRLRDHWLQMLAWIGRARSIHEYCNSSDASMKI